MVSKDKPSSSQQQPQSPSQPQAESTNIFGYLAKHVSSAWETLSTKVSDTYNWLNKKDKRDSLWNILKSFGSYKFLTQAIIKLPWIISAWAQVLSETKMRNKFFSAWSKVATAFDFVISQPSFKQFAPGFNQFFAQLLFFPKYAAEVLGSEKKGEKGCQERQQQNTSLQSGEAEVCISVQGQSSDSS